MAKRGMTNAQKKRQAEINKARTEGAAGTGGGVSGKKKSKKRRGAPPAHMTSDTPTIDYQRPTKKKASKKKPPTAQTDRGLTQMIFEVSDEQEDYRRLPVREGQW